MLGFYILICVYITLCYNLNIKNIYWWSIGSSSCQRSSPYLSLLGPATTDVRGKWVSFGENKLRVSAGSLRGDLVQASPFTKQEMVIRSDKNVKINPITHTITEKRVISQSHASSVWKIITRS